MNLNTGKIKKSSRPIARAASSVFAERNKKDGFSLLELVVVVVVLGILSSVSLPRIGSFLAYADIDQAKSLLNSAAADCLQKYRTDDDDKDEIDETIISDDNLNPIGFEIDKSNNYDTCSQLQLKPTNKDDEIRFPIGFTLIDGNLTKIAEPTSSDDGSRNSCKRWAGTRCDENEDLKELIAWKKGIEQAKQACDDRFEEWENNELDQCTWVLRGQDGHITATAGMHVDDFIFTGTLKDPPYEEAFRQIRATFTFGEWKINQRVQAVRL